MSRHQSETEKLVARAFNGDKSAERHLMTRHRDRLRKMVAVHLDPRLVTRVDPSDVVQETMIIAFDRLQGYLQHRPVPFYVWLRQIAWNRLIDVHRIHIKASKRTVTRECQLELVMSEHSANQLAEQLVAQGISPGDGMIRDELRSRMRHALTRLPAAYREVLVMRQLERLTTAEIAAALRVPEGTVKSRHFRALERMRELLSDAS